ncbi:cytochrome P450 hydroxylase [Actinoplanes italicus]|uniref:Cytochrome P450 n=1 Tax=Actinoplanes italicus TaxID=113567 RepID=A0A2T0K143_9ACTN|nr:cytochrome P450 [Actinoplanes italicus]PRX16514.1 cytochrome P450 [Actinoplanes italicus]GIE33719.1 cytochrome P450 hydroxylase [Actinoplanes italicus]
MSLFGEEYTADPHPALAELREAGPVHRVTSAAGVPFWMVTRWDEARQVLTDPSLSKRQPVDQLPASLRPALATQMLLRDPPDHTRLRRLVSAAFTPRRTRELTPAIERITDRLLDELGAAPEPDLIAGFAVPLPFEVICELLGVPPRERAPLRAWSDTIIVGGPAPADMVAAMSGMVTYFGDLLARKRADPEDDLLGALLTMADEGDRLSGDELVGMALLLLIAGHETTANLIGNAVHLLCRMPARPDRPTAAVVEEVLRMASPAATSTYRVTTRPLTLGTVTIPAGEQVLVSLLAANRDPERFTDPDTFDPDRGDGGHLAFGHGIHFCLGAPLARLEAGIALDRLFARHPDLEAAVPPEDLRWRSGLLMHGLAALPVRLGRPPA